MKPIALCLLAALTAACQPHRCFVDIDRATWGTEDGKRAQEQLQRDGKAKVSEVNELAARAKAAEDAGLPTAAGERRQAAERAQVLQAQHNQDQEVARRRLVETLRPALIRVAADRRAAVIELASSMAFVDPAVDVTDEVIRRANDAARASEVAALKAENERLKAKGKSP